MRVVVFLLAALVTLSMSATAFAESLATYQVKPGMNIDFSAVDKFEGVQTKAPFDVYRYSTDYPTFKDEILVQNGVAVMVKESLVDRNGHYAPIRGFMNRFGQPEKIYYDSYSGDQVYTWISQGFAVAGNRELNEAVMTYRFAPSSTGNFEAQFSTQLLAESHPGREGR